MNKLTDEQYVQLSEAMKKLGRGQVPREYAEELGMFWNFEQILEYFTR